MPPVKGLTTEDILSDMAKVIPPRRLENEGVIISDVRNQFSCGTIAAKKLMNDQGLVPVRMRIAGAHSSIVYMVPAQAEQYKEWIVKE